MPKKVVATFAVATWVLGTIAGLSILGLAPMFGGGDSAIQASALASGAEEEEGIGLDPHQQAARRAFQQVFLQ